LLKAILGRRLIDCVTQKPLDNPVILVEDQKIVAIEQLGPYAIPAEAHKIDLQDFTLLPGLIDAHAHLIFDMSSDPHRRLHTDNDHQLLLRMASNAQLALRWGVTTIRDCGARNHLNIELRESIKEGVTQGPRVLACGLLITTTGGHCYFMGREAEGVDELRKAVREQLKADADFIKIMAGGGRLTPGKAQGRRITQYTVQELQAAIDEAHRLGVKVSVHAHSTASIRNAVEAGADSIEHCQWLAEDEGVNFDEKVLDTIAKKGIYVVPTLASSFPRDRVYGRDDITLISREHRLAIIQKMFQAGVKFVAGGDTGALGARFDEPAYGLELMVQAGMSTWEAIQTATRTAAQCLGLEEEVGTIKIGKKADIIAVVGNPLENINAFWKVRRVIKDGEVII
jgi:imidazolonepropionase-like amidohydrolase